MPLVLPRSTGIQFAFRTFVPLLFLVIFGVLPANASPQTAGASSTAIPVLVSDFELFSVPPPPNSPATTPPNQPKTKTPPASEDADAPSIQALRLMDFFAVTLVETLNKNGHNARRARGQKLSKGALLRGVFAEPDEKNRVRRALLGGTSLNPRFLLYVGIFNLARPDQPLYHLAQEQPGGAQFGPVITLNNYIPLAKYELDKNPSDEDVRKICAQIAVSLTTLLSTNPSAFSQ
jgi:hypothetical protein